jgi:hemerythrin
MGFFVWKDNFKIGNEVIDRQHRQFLETLNSYYEIMFGGKKGEVDKELIDKLKDYAATHFRFEENLMESIGYPEIKRHQNQHRSFESMVRDFDSTHLKGKSETLRNAVMLLRDWFLNHILDEDKRILDKPK